MSIILNICYFKCQYFYIYEEQKLAFYNFKYRLEKYVAYNKPETRKF